jgi:hypothetical protein
MIDDSSTLPAAIDTVAAGCRPSISLPRSPKKKSGCKKQKSARTRRAYRLDVHHSMRSLAITTPAELRQADHKAVIAWERFMRETEHAAASTIRRRLAALSSLDKHLVRHDRAQRNPVGEIERPAINRDEGSTLAFAKGRTRCSQPARKRSAGEPIGCQTPTCETAMAAGALSAAVRFTAGPIDAMGQAARKWQTRRCI